MKNGRRRFIGVPLTLDTQDIYLTRHGIEVAMRQVMPRFQGRFLDVGCGKMPYRDLIMASPSKVTEYIGLDLAADMSAAYSRAKPDLTWDGREIPLPDASVHSAMATEVLEHCPEPSAVLREIARVLAPAGTLFITVPFLWPLHDVPYDEYRYTPFALKRLLSGSGFIDIEVRPMGGWHASLAQMIGLYVSRAPIHPRKRQLLQWISLPIVRALIKRDRIPDVMTSPMITGLSATARKA